MIQRIQIASTLRTLGQSTFWGQVLNFLGSFPHQGNLETKTKFPNPPHQQTLCPSTRSVCWLAKARYATAQWLRTRSGNTRLLFRTLLVSCRLGLPAPGLWKYRIETKFSRPASSSPCGPLAQGSDPHPRHQES